MAAREMRLISAALHERKTVLAQRRSAGRRVVVATRDARQAKLSQLRAVYAAAAINRLNADWVMGPLSADLAIRGDLRALRDRARQLTRDNPLAARYVRLAVENIVGADGMTVEPQVVRDDGTLDDETNAYLKGRWAAWCESAGVDGRTWHEIEALAVRMWKSEGEHLISMTPTRANPFGFALQMLDNDQLDHEYFGYAPSTGNEIRLGVEVDRWMKAVAYWLWTSHPSETVRGRMRIRAAAEQILHIADFDRPNQTRGVTPFATVMQDLNHLAGMQDAMLILQRTAACKMGFIKVDPDKTTALEDDDAGSDEPITWDAEPGKIEQLPAGMSFEGWDPGMPGAEYDPFTRNVERKTSAGLNVSYSSLTGDLSQANYGSQRGGLLSERDGWRRDQQTLIGRMHRPVYREWLRYGILSGAIDLPFDLERYGRVHIQPRGFDWIDPSKDIEVSLREVDAGLNSLTNIAASKGRDFKKLLLQRKQERELAAAMGVPINLTAAKPALPDVPDDLPGATNANTKRPKLAAS